MCISRSWVAEGGAIHAPHTTMAMRTTLCDGTCFWHRGTCVQLIAVCALPCLSRPHRDAPPPPKVLDEMASLAYDKVLIDLGKEVRTPGEAHPVQKGLCVGQTPVRKRCACSCDDVGV